MIGSGAVIRFLGADDVERFDQQLTGFLGDTAARCALLVDRTGRLLARSGHVDLDETAFASLASADFAASDQLAALLGENEFTSLYHHGASRSMFLADIGGLAILAVLFDNRTTLGMVRIKTKSLVPQIAESLHQIVQRGPSGAVLQMDSDWANQAESEIDRLFQE